MNKKEIYEELKRNPSTSREGAIARKK